MVDNLICFLHSQHNQSKTYATDKETLQTLHHHQQRQRESTAYASTTTTTTTTASIIQYELQQQICVKSCFMANKSKKSKLYNLCQNGD